MLRLALRHARLRSPALLATQAAQRAPPLPSILRTVTTATSSTDAHALDATAVSTAAATHTMLGEETGEEKERQLLQTAKSPPLAGLERADTANLTVGSANNEEDKETATEGGGGAQPPSQPRTDAVLASRSRRYFRSLRDRIIAYRDLPPPLSSQDFPYYVHPAVTTELLSITRTTMDPLAHRRLVSQFGLHAGGMILLTCPLPGSETYMETVAKGLARQLHLDFLSIDKHDLHMEDSMVDLPGRPDPMTVPFANPPFSPPHSAGPPVPSFASGLDKTIAEAVSGIFNNKVAMNDLANQLRSKLASKYKGDIQVISVNRGLNGEVLRTDDLTGVDKNASSTPATNSGQEEGSTERPSGGRNQRNRGRGRNQAPPSPKPGKRHRRSPAQMFSSSLHNVMYTFNTQRSSSTNEHNEPALAQGKLLFVHDIDSIMRHPTRYQAFQRVLAQNRERHKNLIVVGGIVTTLKDRSTVKDMDESSDDDGNEPPKWLKRIDLFKIFGGRKGEESDDDSDASEEEETAEDERSKPSTPHASVTCMNLVPPRDRNQRSQLESQIRADVTKYASERNRVMLRKAFERSRILHDDLSALNNLDGEEFSKESLSRMLSVAVGMQLSEDPAASSSNSDELKLELKYIQAAINARKESLEATRSYLHGDQLSRGKLDRSTLSFHESRLLSCIVPPHAVSVRFDDIGSLDKHKVTLRELISLPLQRPDIFNKGVLKQSVSGVLLFGPPGTGKTMLAKAVAAESGANFMALSASNIMDKYVGEGEKNAKAIFTLARKLAPCVIFLDEVDALLQGRGGTASTYASSKREIINEIMTEWDGVNSRNEGVIVMAATNRPFDLDDAVLRRVPRRLLVDLPDETSRVKVLGLLLKEEQLAPDVSAQELAKRTDMYSGSDLKNLCIAAAMNAVRENLSTNGPMASNERVLKLSHFERAIDEVKASLAEEAESLQELRKWNNMYGEGRKKSRMLIGFEHDKVHEDHKKSAQHRSPLSTS